MLANSQTGKVTAKSGVNVRTGPGTSYSKIGAIAYGTTFEILGSSNGWYKMKYQNKDGYVCGDYIEVSGSSSGKTGYVNVDSSLNVRKGPGTSYDKIGKLYPQQEVTVISTENGWCKIKYNSGYGYVSAEYITYNKPSSNKGSQILAKAKTKLGCKYVWGAEGPNTFDCSGLVMWAHNQVGIKVPRVSYEQAKAGRAVSRGSEQEGDIVAFCTHGTSVSHVGLYAGKNSFIHAPHTGDVVKITQFTSYYNNAWRASRRCW